MVVESSGAKICVSTESGLPIVPLRESQQLEGRLGVEFVNVTDVTGQQSSPAHKMLDNGVENSFFRQGSLSNDLPRNAEACLSRALNTTSNSSSPKDQRIEGVESPSAISVGKVSSPSAWTTTRPLLTALEKGSSTSGAGSSGIMTFGGSWKNSGRGSIERRRLAALGFEEELTRDYDFWASWGIGMCNIGYLPGTFLGVLTALEAGGPSMYALAFPISGFFMCFIAAILGEMASTWPVAGAMFTWTFRLCRTSRILDPWARFLSWIVGSSLLCSHVLVQILVAYQLSSMCEGVADYFGAETPGFWPTVGICWVVLFVCGVVVSSPISRSPLLWRACGFLLVAGFVAINVILLTQAKTINSARYVFLSYSNTTGWSSKAYVYLIGWVLTCVASGMEACAHIAEDTKSPSRTVPLAMFWSTAASYILGWISICVYLATMDPNGADPSLQRNVALIANSVPRPYATAVLCIVLFAMVCQNVAQLLATSRFIWSLARESAIPFSQFFRKLSVSHRQPLPAIWIVVLIAAPALMLLGISVSIVGTILLEGAGATVMFAYFLPIALYLCCPDDSLAGDGRAQWTLRGFSQPLAWLGSGFAMLFIVALCLPTGFPVNSLTASYASGIIFGLLLLSSLTWIFYGNLHYAGPIRTTTKWTVGAEVELPRSTIFKSTTVPFPGSTSSNHHGRTAHVFSSFPDMTSGLPGTVSAESGLSEGSQISHARSYEIGKATVSR